MGFLRGAQQRDHSSSTVAGIRTASFERAIVGRARVRGTVPGAKCTAAWTENGAVQCGEHETADRASAAEALRSRSDLARWRSPSAYGSRGRGRRQRASDDGAASATSTDAHVDAGQHPQSLLPVGIRQPVRPLAASAQDGTTRHQQRSSALSPQDGAAVGHQPRVADLDEAIGQDVTEKALDEALDIERHGFGAAGTKGNAAFIEGQ
jgi:hypothetical protein